MDEDPRARVLREPPVRRAHGRPRPPEAAGDVHRRARGGPERGGPEPALARFHTSATPAAPRTHITPRAPEQGVPFMPGTNVKLGALAGAALAAAALAVPVATSSARQDSRHDRVKHVV